MIPKLLPLLLLAAAAPLAAAPPPATAPDYNRDIRPLLSRTCFACHGFDAEARKADLRLDTPEGAYRRKDDITPLVPGSLENSEVWKRITSTDPDELMPPPESHQSLNDAEKRLLRQWIESGAPYARHWSFLPPVKAPVPDLPLPEGGNEIDAFVLARLNQEELPLSPAADRATLVRRASLALTGLPPSPEEVARFTGDESPEALTKLTDSLLASPHYGERMALDWLDAARYADTNGFSIDGGRHMWLWRDWVINAFNTNLPYHQFLEQQIAGDLLPGATPDLITATGFQRNNMVTHEGGTIPEENLTNYNADRVRTLGESVLGLTLGCAQCHDHKFDPVSQTDYYRLFAYFNTLPDKGLDGDGGTNPGPSVKVRTVLRTGEEPGLEQEIEVLTRRLATPDPDALRRWIGSQRAALALRGENFQLFPLTIERASTPNLGNSFTIPDDRSHIVIDSADNVAIHDLVTRLPETSHPVTGIRLVVNPDKNGFGYGKDIPGATAAERSGFVLSGVTVSADTMPVDQANLFRVQAISRVTASRWIPRWQPGGAITPDISDGWAPEPGSATPEHITFTFDRPVDPAKTPWLTVQTFFAGGRRVPGNMTLQAFTGVPDDSDLPSEIIAAVLAPDASRTPAQQEAMEGWFRENSPATRADRIALTNASERLEVLRGSYSVMVMAESESPRVTRILHRGDYQQPGDPVTPGVPAALPQPPPDTPANRLGLARWIIAPDNPLTARVAVNRIWQMLWGTGLVRTGSDFGAQGEYPSHPELLDWLTVDFTEHGWNVKRLVRQIVTSAAWRQSSVPAPGLLERDPGNLLLARGPRFRLPAEFIRDSALAVSGLLVPRLGGPSVNPYTPGDLWREVSHYGSTPATAQNFVQDHGGKLYRRSLYTYWKRTAPPPNMAAFDAPSREVCTISRAATNTPLQALVTLNDPQFVEAARALAQRTLQQPGDDPARLRHAFLAVTSRPPSADELSVLTAMLSRESARYAANPADAEALLAIGESPRDPALPAPQHAAWTQVCSLLLNLSETVTFN